MKNFCVAFFVVLLLLTSCTSNGWTDKELSSGLVYTKDLLENVPDADSAFRQIVRDHKIVFIGSGDHLLVNDGAFVGKNMQMLYDEGVRYVFYEGGEPPDDYTEPLFGTVYPWFPYGEGYSTNKEGSVERVNKTKPESEKIQKIMLEAGRPSLPPEMTYIDMQNYRDTYMFDIFQEVMQHIKEDEKCLILAGDTHGASQEVLYTEYGEKTNTWNTLGFYLKNEYGDDYFSISFQTLNDSLFYFGGHGEYLQSFQEWDDIPKETKFLTPTDINKLSEVVPIGFDTEAVFDGYIVEKEGHSFIPYEYAVFDNEVLVTMISHLEYLNERVAIYNGNYDYANPDTYYLLSDFLRVTYYLKLYFGDQFAYDMWNPTTTLKQALEDLRTQASGNDFSDMVVLNIPDEEGLRKYKKKMLRFYISLTELIERGDEKQYVASIAVKYDTPTILELQELIPQDLWTAYWLALMHTEAEFYNEALGYWQSLLAEPLAKSMLIYPEALELASICAEKLGDGNLSVEYIAKKESLWNEHNIDVGKISLLY